MKRFVFPSATRTAAWVCVFSMLAGCDTMNQYLSADRVNYKNTGAAPPLVVPGDLTAVPLSQRFVAPTENIGLGGIPDRVMTTAGNATVGIPNEQDALGMHVERDGDRRWLVVDGRTPEQLWSQLEEFWRDNGFSLGTDTPETGVLVTDWAENRANIPNDWFRRTVGKVIDFAYSSGTRDRFRTLVNRTQAGNTDISITHSMMEEVLTGAQGGTSSRWVERPRNPQLEEVFLVKLMEKFGLTAEQANQLLANAHSATTSAKVVGENASALELSEPFQRAWPRIGLAFDRTNFTVEQSNRSKGLYQVRYIDSAQELKREGLFGKLFSHDPAAAEPAREFFVKVRALDEERTQVAVVDANGEIDASAGARQILQLLRAQLN